MTQIRFQTTRNFLPHATRARSIIISRFPLCAPRQVENYNYPRAFGPHSKRIAKRARSRLRGANIRGTQCRGKRLGMSRRRASFRRGKWIDVLRACLRGNVEGAYSILPGYIDSRKSTWSEQRATEPAGGRASAMNHRFNPRTDNPPMTRDRVAIL